MNRRLVPPADSGLGGDWPHRKGRSPVFVPDQTRQQAVFDRLRQGIMDQSAAPTPRRLPDRGMAPSPGITHWPRCAYSPFDELPG